MKKIIILIIFFFVSCGIKPTQNNDLTDLKLYGDVKSVTQKRYNALVKFGEAVEGELIDNYLQAIFNENGFIIEKNIYSKKDSLISKQKYHYNSDNNLYQINFYNTNGVKDSSYVFEFNKNNKKTCKKVIHASGQITKIIIYNYDEDNNLTEKIKCNLGLLSIDLIENYYYDKNRVLKEIKIIQNPDFKWIYHYNSNNKVDKEYIEGSDIMFSYEYEDSTKISQYLNGTLFLIYEKKYNPGGKLIEETTLTPDENILQYNSFEYDERGNIIEEIWYDYHDGEKYYTKTINKYDEENNKIESKYYDEKGSIESVRKYDKKGNLLTFVLYHHKHNSKTTFTYTYDENNNNKSVTGDFGIHKSTTHYGYWYDDNNNIIKKVDGDNNTVEEYDYTYHKDGKILDVMKYKYDNSTRIPQFYKKYDTNENLIEKKKYDYDGLLYLEKRYNTNGNVAEEKSYSYNDEGDSIKITYSLYNDDGNLISQKVHNTNRTERTILFVYDENKNKIEEKIVDLNNHQILNALYNYDEYERINSIKIFDQDDNLKENQKYQYTTDGKNNWIKKVVKDADNMPHLIIKRIIEYY